MTTAIELPDKLAKQAKAVAALKNARQVVIDACVLVSAFKADEPQHAISADLR